MKKYICTVQHDNGTVKIVVSASSIAEAREMVMKFENCPARAVVVILPLKKGTR